MTEIEPFELRHYKFSGRAGQLQRLGDDEGLRTELGANYRRYHEALAEDFEALGEAPNPVAFKDYGSYAQAAQREHEMYLVEVLLRRLHARATGATNDQALKGLTAPLVDERHRLQEIDGEHAQRVGRRGRRSAAEWAPPAAPIPAKGP